MKELITISQTTINGAEVNSVNARELYEVLEIKKDFSDWIKAQINSLGLEKNIDFLIIPFLGENPKNGRPSKEYIVSTDTAKHIAMASRTLKGKEVRTYFIKVEKQATQIKPLTFEEMAKQTILLADKRIKELEHKIEQDKPKVTLANTLMSSENTLDVELFSKALFDETNINLGRNKLFKWFRDKGYLNDKNRPYQQFLDRGYFKVKEGTYINQTTQETQIYFQLRITTKGQLFFTNRLIDEFQKA